MSERTPAFNRLCEAALLHFAKDGYEGASLSTIADALGIRKASLYSHVKSKDELFLLLFSDAVAAEEAFAESCFANPTMQTLPGEAYLQVLGERYETSLHLQLFFKAIFMPPIQHKEQIVESCMRFYGSLRRLFLDDFKRFQFPAPTANKSQLYAECWLGIVDSICIELFYVSPERATLRKEAMLMLLREGLGSNGK